MNTMKMERLFELTEGIRMICLSERHRLQESGVQSGPCRLGTETASQAFDLLSRCHVSELDHEK